MFSEVLGLQAQHPEPGMTAFDLADEGAVHAGRASVDVRGGAGGGHPAPAQGGRPGGYAAKKPGQGGRPGGQRGGRGAAA